MSETHIETKIEITPTLTTKLVAVQKRGGETVPFDAIKIYNAIKRAVDVTTELSNEQIISITQSVLDTLGAEFAERTPSVETIQDTVIRTLMDNGAYKTAESYIIYRQKRTEIRESMVDAVDIIEGYVGGSNWRIKEMRM